MDEEDQEKLVNALYICLGCIGALAVILFTALIVCSCTYSITMVHTEGAASDVIDENQRADPTVSPTLTVPVSPM